MYIYITCFGDSWGSQVNSPKIKFTFIPDCLSDMSICVELCFLSRHKGPFGVEVSPPNSFVPGSPCLSTPDQAGIATAKGEMVVDPVRGKRCWKIK